MNRELFSSLRRRDSFHEALCLMAVALFALTLTSCSNKANAPRIIRVPTDKATIQEAVSDAHSGDMVLIADGTYSESVSVETDGITIRGMDRNSVIVDGQGTLSTGFIITSNGVTIQNLTIHSFQQNGIAFDGISPNFSSTGTAAPSASQAGKLVLGYHVDHVTAYNNGLNGVYASASRNGLIENTFVAGHREAGFHVGQCNPCNVVLRNNISESNAIGQYGPNASGNVFVVNSIYRNNRSGIDLISQRAEKLSPQETTVVAGNLVDNNANADAPENQNGFFGTGIAIGGGAKNTVMKNRVTHHKGAGILLSIANGFEPVANRVTENFLEKNGTDMVYSVSTSGGNQNCFMGNSFVSSSPVSIEAVFPCTGVSTATSTPFQLPAATPNSTFHGVEKPSPQPTLINAATTVWAAVVGAPTYPTLANIALPEP